MVVAAAGDPRRVRNTCIMAHVDHGKTTLADHLVAYGGDGLLNPSMAGKVRFMDHLREEQERAITMKSASVLLRHRDGTRVHLIDSPGHADFCSEVSAAARVADSALIVVDAVDGLGVQTHAALRKAFAERLRPCLVLNKLDRLVTDLRLDPGEAYARLGRFVAEANSVYSTLRSGSYFSSLLDGRALAQQADDGDDGEDTFVPQKGNVVFACARDGWGFRIQDFAAVMARGRPAEASKLLGGLWGPYYWDKEKKTAMAMARGTKKQPMFVEFVLKRLWKVYEYGLKEDGANWLRDHVVQTFNLKVSERELQSKDRPKAALEAVMRAWLPLAETVMTMIVECTPDPVAAQRFRGPTLMPERELPAGVSTVHAGIVAEAEKMRRCVAACSASTSAPVLVFVSKMFVVKHKDLPPTLLNHGQETAGELEDCFLAFARVFSGVLHAGQKVFVLSPMYDPVKGDTTGKHLKEVELEQLYEMLGEGLRPVASVGAGNVAAIRGLGEHVMKTVTLSSTRNCWPFASMAFQVSPILKVAIEPANVADLGAFREGLRLLNRADPLVEYTISEKGEHILAAAGNVHLEHCVKNLRERFAKVELNVSEPLVSFKETIQGEGAGLIDSLNGPQRYVERIARDGKFAVRVKVIRLPDALVKVLEENEELLSRIIKGQTERSNGAMGSQCPQDDDGRSVVELKQDMLSAIDSELEALSAAVDEVKLERYRKMLFGYLHKICALGPSQVGPNLLLVPDVKSGSGSVTGQDGREGILMRGMCHVSEKLGFVSLSDDAELSNGIIDNGEPSTDVPDPEALRNSIISGFQEVTNVGPLCDEPIWGLAFIIEPYVFSGSPDSVNCSYQHKAAVREACRGAMLQSKPRLVEPMYFCELTTPTEHLGRVHSVLGDCRAKVVKDEMQEGTSLFTVHAHLPVAESSEFSEKLRNGSSGAATASLAFSHWEAIPQDPFFVPKTREEIEEFGDGSNMGPNLAKKLIDSVRRRKGLHVDDKVVEHGTKQRTRAKKV